MATFNVVDEILKGTRVPRKHGFPFMTSGLMTITCWAISFVVRFAVRGGLLVDYSREVVFWATNIGARSSSSPASSRQVL